SARLTGDKEVQVVATDYEAYAILDLSSHRGGVAWRVLKLYSRSLEDKGEVMKRFLEVAQERGFTESDVHLLERDLTCVKLLQPGGVPSS
ncbi:epididymal-specific lipocalin-5-like, partial [Tupaia chinensis]|uniref:epididymal-specific lipocalin-5-like n=1 Tax=Tupaia chinensis TaxID=246437 RepID=UPI0003C91EF4